MNLPSNVPVTLLLLVLAPAPATAQEPPAVLPDSGYAPGEYRVFTGTGEPSTLEEIVVAMGAHDVVFVGESHDDPTGHMLEAELLERAWAAYGGPSREGDAVRSGREGVDRRPVALSLEFFERDVQLVLDEYLADLVSESAFLQASRPWPRYASDYRRLVEFAKSHGLDVVAANAPRRYASRVSQHGRASLGELSPGALEHLPPLPYGEPSVAYRDQWIQVISEVMRQEGTRCGVPVDDPPAPVGAHQDMGNQLQSQTLWDASMAWWVSRYLEDHPGALVLHMVGGFHVARGTGTPEHLEAYAPESRAMVVMLRPVEDPDTFEAAPAGAWGDFVIQTEEARTLEALECRAFLEAHGGP